MEPLANFTLPFLAIRSPFIGLFERFAHITTIHMPNSACPSHSILVFHGPFGVFLLNLDDMADLDVTEVTETGNFAVSG